MNLPLFSIVIPTYNSEATLPLVLSAIIKQTYPKNKIEILVVDGGSTDKTLKIAEQFECRIVKNTRTHQVYAKHLGYLKSKGKYIVHLDSDEVLKNRNSLMEKYLVFQKHKDVKAMLCSGYVTPRGYSSVNKVVSEYGDAFSYFLYHNSASHRFFEQTIRSTSDIVYEDGKCLIANQRHFKALPLVELSVMGCVIDKKYLDENFPKLRLEPFLISHVYYMIIRKGGLVGLLKNDQVEHYSVKTLLSYLKKIRSRVINNIYETDMGRSAFSGRYAFYPWWYRYKKMLFVVYTLTLVLPLFDGLYLSLTRKNFVFMLHPFFCFHIVYLTAKYYFLKIMNVSLEIRPWGT